MLSRSTTRVLGLLCVMYFITYVDRVNVSTAAIVFGKEFNLSNTQIGFVCSDLPEPGILFRGNDDRPRWAIPMDIAPKYSGTASGIMNSGSALAAIISPVVGGWIIDVTGNWDWPFIGSMALMLVGALLAFTMKPEQKV